MGTPTITLETLSIKQPWATLVVLGVKTIEIRRWNTPIRGRILIHTGRIADDRAEGWARICKKNAELASLRGGIIGEVELADCIKYRGSRHFSADRLLHCNEPAWFVPPVMYGFRFEKPKVRPFLPCLGQVKFFRVEVEAPQQPKVKPTARRLVSFELAPKPRRKKAL